MTDVRKFDTHDDLFREAMDIFVRAAVEAIQTKGRFTVALAGGSTPRGLYEQLASNKEAISWNKVLVFFGDERTVPPDHRESNYKMAHESLLSKVNIPEANVHRMQGEIDPETAAADYESILRSTFGKSMPQLDLILLGMGDDGHTASLFPGTDALSIRNRLVVSNFVPKLDTWRLTLTATAINQAAIVQFLVAGASKANALRAVLKGEHQPDRLPSQLIKPTHGKLIWLVDNEAAALI